MHIQLPQKVTDSYKLVYISHPARGYSDSGEHSPADSKGVDFHPGPALRKAHSLEHIDIEARRGPASREHSPAKQSGTKDLLGPSHSLKDSIAHKGSPASGGPDSGDCSTAKSSRGIDSSIAHSKTHKSNPASGGPDSRDHSTAHPSGLSNISDKTEEAYSKGHHPPRHISDHPPTTPPRPTFGARSEQLYSRLTRHQRKRLRTLKGKSSVKSKDPPPKTPSYSRTRENPSPIPPPSEDTDGDPSSEHSEVIPLPSSPRSPAIPDLTTPRSISPDRSISPIPTMGTVKDLAEALIEKLRILVDIQLFPP